MPNVKAVVFDIGNVLIEWNPERFYDAEIGPDRRRAMFDAVDLHGVNDQVDRGGNFRDTIYAAAEATPEWADEIRMWHDRWIELASPSIDRSVAVLDALRSNGVQVFALSNFGIESFAYAETQYPFLGNFDRRYISGHMGVVKPYPEIYQKMEADCGVAAAGLLFADDRQENLDAAAARGWQTHLFEGPDGWADRLIAEGLLREGQA